MKFKKLTLLTFVMICFCSLGTVFGQSKILSKGKVTSETGEPILGASVGVKGTEDGVLTDLDGMFSIETASDAILVLSYLGYETLEVAAGTDLDIKLAPSSEFLKEVEILVDKGYGKTKRLAVSSAIASVDGSSIANQTAYSMGTLLQGKATGVQVTNTGGGNPKILIRGFTSLNTSSDPLIILDGINLGRTNLNLINVNDVETVDILKDAAASAIYGSNASGGVIVITTKKGKAGKIKTELNVNYGVESNQNPNMAGAEEYLAIQKRRFTNYTTPSWATDTDWWDATIRQTNVVNTSLSVSGGNEKLTTFNSVSYYRTEGPFYYGHTQRATARLNLDYKVSDYISAGTNLYPRWENWTNSGMGNNLMNSIRTEPILPIFVERPGMNEYSQFSSTFLERTTNPVAVLTQNRHNWNYYLGLIGDVHVDIKPLKNLTFRSQAGIVSDNSFSRSYSPPVNNNWEGARSQNYNIVDTDPVLTKDNFLYASRASSSSSYGMDYRLTNTIDYKLPIGTRQSVNVLLGYEARKESGASVSATRAYIDPTQPGLWNPANGGTPVLATSPTGFLGAGGSRNNETWVSQFGRLNFERDSKYFVEATVRRDGSSRFPTNNKFGIFPSISGSWIASEESFLKGFSPLSFLKFRGGYGSVGNASFNDPSVGLDLLSSRVQDGGNNGSVFFGGAPSGILTLARPGNANLIWETTSDVTIAMESYWLKNKIYFNAEIFNRKSKDLLFNDAAGRQDLGIRAGSWYNLGTMEVKGIEGVLGFRDKVGDFKYNVSANVSTAKVYLNELGTNNVPLIESRQGDYRISEDLGGSIIRIDKEGGRLGNFYGYEVLGVFQNKGEVDAHSKSGKLIQPRAVAGDFKFADRNNDGLINEMDKKVIGNAYSDFDLGLNLNLEYKGIDIAVNGFGKFGHEVFWLAKKWFQMGALGSNVIAGSSKLPWTPENATNSYPRLINDAQDANNNLKSSNSWFIEKGDYFRINNLQVGYSLPKSVLSVLHVPKVRLNVNLQNYFTFTSYEGLNPEIYNGDTGNLAPGFDLSQSPASKALTFGLNVGF
jgi:TonB-dependent starch-binding outer membrane protein SusC